MQRYRFLLVACLAPALAAAQETGRTSTCEQAAAVAEQAHGLPAGLLAAIGRVESGRRNPATGRAEPWPYTIDVEGAGAAFPTAEAAQAAVLRAQSQGQSSIDVGCFQVNLLAHPQAFPSLQDAFDPARNADYAATFLNTLHQRTGDWPTAVMAYHSATPGLGEFYRDRVLADWAGTDAPPPPTALPHLPVPGLQVWTPAAAGSAPSQLTLGKQLTMSPAVTYLTD